MSCDWFIERLSEFKSQEAIVDHDQSYSYQDILGEYYNWKAILEERKVRQGEVIVIESDFSMKSLSLLIALIENRNIIVPLSNVNPEYYYDYLQIAETDRVIKISGQDFSVQEMNLKKSNELLKSFIKKEEPGLILFTSGSTGKPKAVLHNFTKLLNKYHEKKKQYRTLLFLLFDHIGGINTLFYTLANGGAIIKSRGKDIHTICSQIEKNKVELLPTTPTFLTLLLLSEEYLKWDFSALRLTTYGTEPMPESILQKLNLALPHIRFKQTYGASELGILQIKSQSSDSVWLQIDPKLNDVKVIDDYLYIKTDTAMEGYLNAPSPFDQDGWYNTQDKVEQNGDYLKILGRASEIINVGGLKVFPAEIEDVIIQLPGIRNAVVFGEKNPILGNIIAAKVNINTNEDELSLKRRLKEFCKDRLKPFMVPAKIYISQEELYNTRFKRTRN